MSRQAKWVMLGLVVLALAGCGRRGPLEPAGGAPAEPGNVQDIAIVSGKSQKVVPVQPGNAKFILDPLL